MSKNLPARCYALLISTKQLIEVRRGEMGYYPIRVRGEHVFGDEAKELRDMLNEAAGVNEYQREAMEQGSIFGWDVPAADPDTWRKLAERVQRN